ncbi:MAG: hypothetical protein AB7P00_16760 [Sandaracinaceae bacterium]
MNRMRWSAVALGAAVAMTGCDGGPPPAPPRQDGGLGMDAGATDPDAGADAATDAATDAAADAATVAEGPRVRCVYPVTGAMITATPGSMQHVTLLVADPGGVTSATVNGSAVTPDADGVVELDVTTRFGINNVAIQAENAAGGTTEEVCSFLVSATWQSGSATIEDSLSMKLNPTGIDDGDATDALDSLNDHYPGALPGGQLQETIDTRFTTGGADI